MEQVANPRLQTFVPYDFPSQGLLSARAASLGSRPISLTGSQGNTEMIQHQQSYEVTADASYRCVFRDGAGLKKGIWRI